MLDTCIVHASEVSYKLVLFKVNAAYGWLVEEDLKRILNLLFVKRR